MSRVSKYFRVEMLFYIGFTLRSCTQNKRTKFFIALNVKRILTMHFCGWAFSSISRVVSRSLYLLAFISFALYSCIYIRMYVTIKIENRQKLCNRKHLTFIKVDTWIHFIFCSFSRFDSHWMSKNMTTQYFFFYRHKWIEQIVFTLYLRECVRTSLSDQRNEYFLLTIKF